MFTSTVLSSLSHKIPMEINGRRMKALCLAHRFALLALALIALLM